MMKYIKKGGMLLDYVLKKNDVGFRAVTGNHHTLTVGSTRSGKTRCFVLPSIGILGLALESMIISDPKGELYEYTSPFLRSLGYDVWVLDFKNQRYSQRYNLLQSVIEAMDEMDMPRAIDKVWDLCNMFVPKDAHGEKIWSNGEMSILATAIMSVVYDNRRPDSRKYQNMTNVYHFIARMCRITATDDGREYIPLALYIDDLMKKQPNHPAIGLADISFLSPERMRASFYASALTTLQLYTSVGVYNITCDSDFKAKDFGLKPTVLYFILPDEKETYYPIVSTIVDQIYTELVSVADRMGGVLPNRVNFILDEFGNFSKIPSFNAKMTAGAGRGIRLNMFLQGFMQLEEKYGKESAKIILGNCEYLIYLRSTDLATLEEISKLLDNYTTRSYTTGGSIQNRKSSSNFNLNLVGRRLMTVDDIKKLRRPDTLVISSHDPMITHCPDISKTVFNDFFGMGDEEHNINLRQKRFNDRPMYFMKDIEIWNIADNYTN